MKISPLIVLFLLFVIAGCSSMTTSEKSQKRSELDAMATKAITGLIKQDPVIQAEIDQSLGYAVANMKLTKVPIVGGGGGEGVFVNQKHSNAFTLQLVDLILVAAGAQDHIKPY